MNSFDSKKLREFIHFVVSTENQSYIENPNPTAFEKAKKEKLYKDKIDEITKRIAEREGVQYED